MALQHPGLQGPDPHQLRPGHDLHSAWQTPQPEGGRRIVIATGRYIRFAEARNQPRTIDYPFTRLELPVGKDGKGQGKMAVAARIGFDKKKNGDRARELYERARAAQRGHGHSPLVNPIQTPSPKR